MRNTWAIAQRELLSLFCSPIGYVVVAGFLLITGAIVWFSGLFAPGKPATLQSLFSSMPLVLTIIVPAIAMRSISEEYRTGTIESLMTAPVSDAQLVLGKFLASAIFYVIMLGSTLIYMVLLEAFGNPDWGASMASYLGLVLVGLSFTAFGVFASSLTRNQIVAWILGSVPLLLFAFLGYWAAMKVEGWQRVVLQQINVMGRFEEFTRGLVTLDGLVFFLGTTAMWVFLAIKVVESRRWR